jgi:hypothetical protein
MPLADQVELALRDRGSGWWVRLVLDAFRYLETDFGYSLAEVRMHFRGNYIRYRGPVFEFVTDYDPEDTRSIGAELWVVEDLAREGRYQSIGHPRAFDVNRLLRARDPGLPLPATIRARLDPDDVSKAVATWAQGLRELAPDVLAGAWPDDGAVHHLW